MLVPDPEHTFRQCLPVQLAPSCAVHWLSLGLGHLSGLLHQPWCLTAHNHWYANHWSSTHCMQLEQAFFNIFPHSSGILVLLLAVQRAQALIKASFQDINQGFTLPLQACLKAAQQAIPAAPGGYYAPQWPEQGGLGSPSQLGSVSRHTGAGSRSFRMRKRARRGQVSSAVWFRSYLYQKPKVPTS